MSRKLNHHTSKRDISSLTQSEKIALTKHIFYNLKESDYIHGATEIDQCFKADTDMEHQLSFSRLLRGNQWLRMHGFKLPQSTPVLTNAN